MKAVVYTQYGSPDVLQLKEVAKPTPKDNEILIKIRATSVTAVDSTFRKGDDFSARLFTGIMKPKNPTLGSYFAGEVEAVGKDVTRFKVGEQLFGPTEIDFGAHAEYITLSEEAAVVKKPSNVSYQEVAALGEALTALPFLRDTGKIKRGDKILINGASGAIGSIAVQLAKYYGAEVTGVCSTANLELVKSLGADAVVDYTKEDFAKKGQTYDIIFDTVGKRSFSDCKKALKPNGRYLTTVLSLAILPQMLWTSKVGSKKALFSATGLRSASEKQKDLHLLSELIEAGTLKPVIDKSYPLAQIAEAHSHVDKGHKKGSVVVEIAI
ncbi:NAD(P)-dependent alcohol dehydrogenase [Anaerolineales bacterium HSG25]|nr:NAD(P)-dependent alcohol dehydrogenase [Anaerolineales bacterium HSG25]